VTFTEARQALETALYTSWTETPIVWENVDDIHFSGPNQHQLTLGSDPFIAIEIFIHTSQTITVPGHCIRYPGTLEFGVFTKSGTGGKPSDELLDDLIEIFENRNFGAAPDRIRVKNIVTSVKYHNNSGWYVSKISFAFQFERYVTNP
jgi:hypothetical protein